MVHIRVTELFSALNKLGNSKCPKTAALSSLAIGK